MMISYGEYLEMFEFTPEGYLRFDVLLDEFMKLTLLPRISDEEKEIFRKKMVNLLYLADPNDYRILRSSEAWRKVEEDYG